MEDPAEGRPRGRWRRRALIGACLGAAGAVLVAVPALGAFPYPAGSGPDYADFRLGAAEDPAADLGGNETWMYAATPEASPPPDPLGIENGYVRGARLADAADAPVTAWEYTTGRPDVVIAVHDSGIQWNELGPMRDLRLKTHLNAGELPAPQADRSASLLDGGSCASFTAGVDDANGDGIFNLADYACDSRVTVTDPRRVGPPDFLTPQDLLLAFSDADDDDSNGFADDIVGWDFMDDDNDPFDDVQYGHGTGEAQDSAAEAANGEDGIGTCPNCMAMHIRVGDSFIADVNRFARGVIYSTDNGAMVVQEALGTLNNTRFARQAVDYAYGHGVTVIASAADEAAQHNNWPSSLPHVILVNSVTRYDEAITPASRSYLQFNGCTNFNAKITLAIPSVSCSSDATGRGSGMAGLVYSAALNAIDRGLLEPHPDCERAVDVDGEPGLDPCPISANEVRQLMASGTVDGQLSADDVDFSGPGPEPSCESTGQQNSCTHPFLSDPGTSGRAPGAPPGASRSYPARGGHDQYYGYGRVNMNRAVKTTVAGDVPPEAEITSPDWYSFVDPDQGTLDIRGEVDSRGGPYICRLLVAPGSYPNNAEVDDGGDFKPVEGGHHCNGDERSGSFGGLLGSVDLEDLKSRFPPNAGDFDGREPGIGTSQLSTSGRPNIDPYGFVVKVVVTSEDGGTPMTGEDQRNLRLHRDADLLEGFPRDLGGDGASSPLFVDVDGDNRNELLLGGSDGFVHAYRRDGSEVSGWPVRGDRPPLHLGGRAFETGEVSDGLGGAILASVAAADMDRDGAPEVAAADLEGKVYVWNASGERLFTRESEIAYSGKPLQAFRNVRNGQRNRTQHGFIGSPVLADLDRNDGGRLEIVAAAMDRHVYAWSHDGSAVPGFPALLVDLSKVSSIDPQTHAVDFDESKLEDADDEQQGAIIDTPAVGDIGGDDAKPEIVVGTNEEYEPNSHEGPQNVSNFQNIVIQFAEAALGEANTRLYALSAQGDPDGNPMSAPPTMPGEWPLKLAQSGSSTLPIVGEGVTGNPIIGVLDCPSGGEGPKIGALAHAGPAFVFNPDATSCYGEESGRPIPLQSDGQSGSEQTDTPVINAFGHPAIGPLDDPEAPVFMTPALGATRALDIALPEYQGGQDFLGAWDASSGDFRPGFPARTNDLQFLTGPSIGDLNGEEGEELVSGSASMDLQGYDADGAPISDAWPKLTSDWMVANPAIGSWGQLETSDDARKVVFAITRAGFMLAYGSEGPACSPSSWPRFHHDNASSGDARRDAVSPGRPFNASMSGGTLAFDAPGDDLLCGTADAYELVHSDSPITGSNFASAEPLGGAPEPAEAGSRQTISLPAGAKRYVALRARDEEGEDGGTNVGRPLVVDRQAAGGGPDYQVPGERCSRPGRGVRGRRVGPVRLGQSRATVRRLRGARRARRRMDRICLTDRRAIRVGYRRGRAALILSSSRRHRAFGLRPGSRARKLRGRARRVRIGPNTWYLRRGRRTTLVFKVRRGRVREVGIAGPRASRSRRGARRFLRSF
jgi:Subtilase family